MHILFCLITSISVTVISSFAVANERCETNAHVVIFSENHVLDILMVPKTNKTIFTKNWEDCYIFANQRSKELPEQTHINVVGSLLNFYFYNGEAPLFIRWKYSGGFLSGYGGDVTRFTNDFVTHPETGSLNYFSDGSLFW